MISVHQDRRQSSVSDMGMLRWINGLLLVSCFLVLFSDAALCSSYGKVDVNTAGVDELAAIEGLSSGQARYLVEHRDANGPFHSIDDLKKVRGIGPRTIKGIKSYIYTGYKLKCWNCGKAFGIASKRSTSGTCPHCNTQWPKDPTALARRAHLGKTAELQEKKDSVEDDRKPEISKYEKRIGRKYKLFDNISFNSIRAASLRDKRIDGSNDYRNKLKPGAIVFYMTNEDRYGKLQILEYGYNLKIRWITYNNDGSVFSSGEDYNIDGTWSFDLDYGEMGTGKKSLADVWWAQRNKVERYLAPRNGAKIRKIH